MIGPASTTKAQLLQVGVVEVATWNHCHPGRCGSSQSRGSETGSKACLLTDNRPRTDLGHFDVVNHNNQHPIQEEEYLSAGLTLGDQ